MRRRLRAVASREEMDMDDARWPILARKNPVAVARAFLLCFGASPPLSERGPAVRAYRHRVASELRARFGVPLPHALDRLVTAACRRRVSADDIVVFIGEIFALEALTLGRGSR